MFRIPAARSRLRTLPCLLLLAGAALLPSSALHAEEAGTLTVTLRNVRDASGSVRAGLYRDPATFRKEDRAVSVAQVPATPEQTIVTFRDLPPGRYERVELPPMPVSATEIRARVAAGQGIAQLVPGPVAGYIDRYNLYRTT